MKVQKNSGPFSVITKGRSLKDMKNAVESISITNINDAVEAINLSSIFNFFVKNVTPQAKAHLDSCKECEEHSSTSGYTVVKIHTEKVYKSTPQIVKLEESIARAEDSLKKKKIKLKALREVAGVEKTTGHYWKAKP